MGFLCFGSKSDKDAISSYRMSEQVVTKPYDGPGSGKYLKFGSDFAVSTSSDSRQSKMDKPSSNLLYDPGFKHSSIKLQPSSKISDTKNINNPDDRFISEDAIFMYNAFIDHSDEKAVPEPKIQKPRKTKEITAQARYVNKSLKQSTNKGDKKLNISTVKSIDLTAEPRMNFLRKNTVVHSESDELQKSLFDSRKSNRAHTTNIPPSLINNKVISPRTSNSKLSDISDLYIHDADMIEYYKLQQNNSPNFNQNKSFSDFNSISASPYMSAPAANNRESIYTHRHVSENFNNTPKTSANRSDQSSVGTQNFINNSQISKFGPEFTKKENLSDFSPETKVTPASEYLQKDDLSLASSSASTVESVNNKKIGGFVEESVLSKPSNDNLSFIQAPGADFETQGSDPVSYTELSMSYVSDKHNYDKNNVSESKIESINSKVSLKSKESFSPSVSEKKKDSPAVRNKPSVESVRRPSANKLKFTDLLKTFEPGLPALPEKNPRSMPLRIPSAPKHKEIMPPSSSAFEKTTRQKLVLKSDKNLSPISNIGTFPNTSIYTGSPGPDSSNEPQRKILLAKPKSKVSTPEPVI
ncbi:hypothetical protein AYI70_g6571 [Smittium culicis]|uniref:Uncharacterized protein n=1 Tax=Smittium culicis TaxID=133412 RepID=A0A1R1XPC8_9FUNG|nr:hypothetical protein AYI70_g8961 [Smittium culicis]OMJ16468.1 hypothetical protein AYI70_g6571 [Smittium culicis]